jgi:hypothetical protein
MARPRGIVHEALNTVRTGPPRYQNGPSWLMPQLAPSTSGNDETTAGIDSSQRQVACVTAARVVSRQTSCGLLAADCVVREAAAAVCAALR